jgi:hypothetical protein
VGNHNLLSKLSWSEARMNKDELYRTIFLREYIKPKILRLFMAYIFNKNI